MGVPVIDSLVASKTVVLPGESFTIKVNAHDPDNTSDTYVGTVQDAAGSPVNATIVITRQDALTFSLTGPGSITQDSADPSLFRVIAPSA